MHVLGQRALMPLQTYGEHDGLPAFPDGAIVQVPRVISQRLQPPPVHAVEQQTPLTQNPLWHELAVAQLPPTAILSEHTPALQ